MSNAQKVAAVSLVAITVSLLTVGLVSSPPTLFRHIVQVSPIVLVLIAVWRGIPSWAFAAIPIFLFWQLIMILIWLYLLGIARIVSGNFSPAEIILTIVIGIASLTGLVAAARSVRRTDWLRGCAFFVIAAGLQVGALWMSRKDAFRQEPRATAASIRPDTRQAKRLLGENAQTPLLQRADRER
jgi:hypothetical protein